MDRTIQSLLGIADDEKRIYRFIDGDVQQEEYQYCQLLDQLVFGDKGYVETLGQTWNMIHDPRFTKIESAFIVNRKAVFGGDARQGKQYMSSDGMFVSTISDLEEYSEVLGEGRYFYTILTHPEELCPVRLWLERIYPGMKKDQEVPKASEDLKCVCSLPPQWVEGEEVKTFSPLNLKDGPDEFLWALIKQECPNYFNKVGKPNKEANRLFALFRADLIGLIADYTPTPLVDAFIELETGDVVGDSTQQTAQVFLEVDILEKALTYRATMRATAAKVLRQVGIEAQLRSLPDPRLTDIERDHLLRMVYQSDWPDEKVELVIKLMTYITWTTRIPYDDRLKVQLEASSANALEDCRDLQTGKLEAINAYTEPSVDVQLDQHAAMMEAILRNPLKQELFIVYAGTEERCGDTNENEIDRLNMRKLFSILTPVFTDPEFVVNETNYWEYMEEAHKFGYYEVGSIASPLEGDFIPSEADFERNRKLREARGEKRMPLEETESPVEEGPEIHLPLNYLESSATEEK